MIAWQDFADAASALVGVPFVAMGRSPEVGLDCVGVPYAAATLAGLSLAPTPVYGLQPTEQELEAGLLQFCERADDPATAHIWQVPLYGMAKHVLVPVRDDGRVTVCVHAWSRRGRVAETLWRRHVAQGWHIKGVEWRPQA